jgi:predicted site-specific integrase-resolvase
MRGVGEWDGVRVCCICYAAPPLTMKPKRIIIYGRVSTADQRCDSQLHQVQEYCCRPQGGTETTVSTDVAS